MKFSSPAVQARLNKFFCRSLGEVLEGFEHRYTRSSANFRRKFEKCLENSFEIKSIRRKKHITITLNTSNSSTRVSFPIEVTYNSVFSLFSPRGGLFILGPFEGGFFFRWGGFT